MDAFDLFKKLSSGAKFDKTRFRSDAVKLRLEKSAKFEEKMNLEDTRETRVCVKRKNENDEDEDEDEDEDDNLEVKNEEASSAETLTLVEGMKVPIDGGKTSKRKKKKIMTADKLLQLEQEKINEYRNKHGITAVGRNVAKPLESFQQLSTIHGMAADLVDNMKKCGYVQPTPIQMQAMPIMLEGRQILACAPTGSGKTAAFLLPVIHHLEGPKKWGFRAVVLSPTRELAKQTYRECVRLSEGRGFRIHIISKVKQALDKYGAKSSQKFDILITTPKRLLFLLNQEPPALSLKNVEWLIVDEADKLFEDGSRGFRGQLEDICASCTNPKLRRAMYSATNTAAVAKWSRRNLRGLVNVTIGQRNAAAAEIDQELLFVGSERGKLIAIRDLIRKGISPPVLIFVQSKERAKELFNELIYDGINVDVIHADRTQTQRDNVVRCFREGKIWVLVCTELMSRGIDFKGVNLVINYDFPPSAISYVHRIGRTGRAGHKGKAITFFTEHDTPNLRSIATVMRASGCHVPEYMHAMKKHSKRDKKKLERETPKRDSISTLPKFKRKKRKNSDAR